jgi:ribosomal protein L25 (general stress protein Ctc)
MLNNVKSMLLVINVDGMELFVLISHVQLRLLKKIPMHYV